MESIVAHPSSGPTIQFRSAWTAGLAGVCPPKVEVTRSNRVERATAEDGHYALAIPYDAAARDALQLASLRCSAI
jgi:hypothetical protein